MEILSIWITPFHRPHLDGLSLMFHLQTLVSCGWEHEALPLQIIRAVCLQHRHICIYIITVHSHFFQIHHNNNCCYFFKYLQNSNQKLCLYYTTKADPSCLKPGYLQSWINCTVWSICVAITNTYIFKLIHKWTRVQIIMILITTQ